MSLGHFSYAQRSCGYKACADRPRNDESALASGPTLRDNVRMSGTRGIPVPMTSRHLEMVTSASVIPLPIWHERRQMFVILAILVGLLLPVGVDAASPRQWFITLTGPERVVANRDYTYTAVMTNDGGAWPASVNAQLTLRLAFDLTERYGEGTVGITDIIVHPTGPQSPDGAFPCATNGSCWFRRAGSQVAFTFTRNNAKVPAIVFDIIVHTASIFRPGNAFTVSAIVQHGSNEPLVQTDPALSPMPIQGEMGAMIVATFPLLCGPFVEGPWGRSDVVDACSDPFILPNNSRIPLIPAFIAN